MWICTWESVPYYDPIKTYRRYILLRTQKSSKSNIKYKINHAFHSLKCFYTLKLSIKSKHLFLKVMLQGKKNLIGRIFFVVESCFCLVSRENGQTFQNRKQVDKTMELLSSNFKIRQGGLRKGLLRKRTQRVSTSPSILRVSPQCN